MTDPVLGDLAPEKVRVRFPPSPDRLPPRRQRAQRAVQLGVRAPLRRHPGAPHRGHRPRPQHRGGLRLDPRLAALARHRLGRGPGGGRRVRPLPQSERFDRSTRDIAAAPARGRLGVRLLLHHRGGRRAPQGQRLQGAGVRRPLPRAHDRAAQASGVRRPHAPCSGCGCPTARSRSTTWSAARSPSSPRTSPTSRCVRANGDPLYTLVNPVDDALMGITHVLRGEDLLSSTPRQIALYERARRASASAPARPASATCRS